MHVHFFVRCTSHREEYPKRRSSGAADDYKFFAQLFCHCDSFKSGGIQVFVVEIAESRV